MDKKTFLLEIGCEELPSSSLLTLANALEKGLVDAINAEKLNFDESVMYAAPRRIAVMIKGLEAQQPNQTIERHGPYIKDAYDKNGTPTLACIGFARSCGVTVDQLDKQMTDKGERVCIKVEKPGQPTNDFLPEMVNKVIKKLPMSKPMRWGDHDIKFMRPVHWIVMMFGHDVIQAEVLGKPTTRETRGHRFHHPRPIHLAKAEDYYTNLYAPGHVIADFNTRKDKIVKDINKIVGGHNAILDERLLDEVAAIVEWPIALKGGFDKSFLAVPKEVLITSMQTHQKCFAIENEQGDLQNEFIVISNIESKDPKAVIKGNERVINARLSDAKFFYESDQKQPLSSHTKALENTVFQKKLGSIADKVRRIEKLSAYIAKKLQFDIENDVVSAAKLSKCDLNTQMVFEFPNLQGVMGYYYALHDGLDKNIAVAIKEYYYPRFSGDILPSTETGCCLALADRIDTLIGILGINQIPTGMKDPFALRRAALAIIRICIEKSLSLDIKKILEKSRSLFKVALANENVVNDALEFIFSRLKYWYVDQGVSAELFEAVASSCTTNLLDFNDRIKAVLEFQKLPEANALAAANKRVSNILKKQNVLEIPKKVNDKLLESDAERLLAQLVQQKHHDLAPLYKKADYRGILTELSQLKEPIDTFFDKVMIMDKDKKKRDNRLALLTNLQQLFTQVADISLLPQPDTQDVN